MSEKCWKIEENRPIKIHTRPAVHGIWIEIDAGMMKYETWQHLSQNHRHQDIGVCYSCYDYKDGKCEFKAENQQELDKWLDKYKDIVSI